MFGSDYFRSAAEGRVNLMRRARNWRAGRFRVNALALRPQLKPRVRVLRRAYGVLRQIVSKGLRARRSPLLQHGVGQRRGAVRALANGRVLDRCVGSRLRMVIQPATVRSYPWDER